SHPALCSDLWLPLIQAKLSQLCEQDKVVQALEQKLQQLHKEKYTLEQALLSASQEIEMNAENPTAIQNVVLQRDELQSGLLSTCREVSRATTELERAWREYERLERDVTTARNQMREQLNRLGEVQTESAGIQRAQMQKEIWRIQDVMEGLSKHKEQRRSKGNAEPVHVLNLQEKEIVPPRPPLPRSYDFSEQPPSVPPLPSDGSSSMLCHSRGPVHLPEEKTPHHVQVYHRNGSYCGPDYRLYKSEPELTTVAEVDESNNLPISSSFAVEHLCIADSGRHRMTLEEQLERMRRHQQACLKEKRKGLSFLGTIEPSPSFSRENSLKERQVTRGLRGGGETPSRNNSKHLILYQISAPQQSRLPMQLPCRTPRVLPGQTPPPCSPRPDPPPVFSPARPPPPCVLPGQTPPPLCSPRPDPRASLQSSD
uniref:Pleckstrin homology domain-containing protein n=1 Tax=Leptobrachium leishanense TaxID=445787 RepID=A0A8C5MPI2_9ANUR